MDPVEGGVANAYIYVPDPINTNDYSGLLGVISNNSNVRIIGVIYNYGMQPVASVPRLVAPQRVQTTAPATRTQGPGSARSNSGIAKIEPIAQGVAKLGVNLSLGVIGYGTISFGVARGADGSVGLYASVGVGATTGFSSGAGPEFGRHTTARGVSSLRGTQAFGGASVGAGPGMGCDLSKDEQTCSIGVGADWSIAMPLEGHVGVEKSWVLELW